ncbi:MAG: hypothetical protein M1837_003268 [Sclerophora amabilis]|nr:MAG: hypothetical protein M1837_003268 [Sclerophora amabilis]
MLDSAPPLEDNSTGSRPQHTEIPDKCYSRSTSVSDSRAQFPGPRSLDTDLSSDEVKDLTRPQRAHDPTNPRRDTFKPCEPSSLEAQIRQCRDALEKLLLSQDSTDARVTQLEIQAAGQTDGVISKTRELSQRVENEGRRECENEISEQDPPHLRRLPSFDSGDPHPHQLNDFRGDRFRYINCSPFDEKPDNDRIAGASLSPVLDPTADESHAEN